MNRNSNGMSTGMAILCTLGILLFIGLMIDLGTPKCIKSGCDNDAKEGSSYCYLHDNSTYRYKSSTSYSGSSNSSSSSSTTKSSNTSSDEKSSGTTSNSKKTYSSGSSSSKKNQSSMDSYDDGYNAIYEDDDYDWDRYWSDDDYAAGVDDAMEDEDCFRCTGNVKTLQLLFSMGDSCYANFNFTVLDTCPVRIGNNVYFGPNCTIATPVHPFRWQERTIKYGLRRLLSRSDDPGWGVAALCCHRPPGTTRLSRSWRCSLTPIREVMARPSARLSQRACCLKKLFGCQGTPCRRGQTVTGSGTGRAFRLGSPSIYNGQILCELGGAASGKFPFLLFNGQKSAVC